LLFQNSRGLLFVCISFSFFSKFLRSRLKAFNNYINIYWDTRDIVKKNVKNKNNSNKQVVHPKKHDKPFKKR